MMRTLAAALALLLGTTAPLLAQNRVTTTVQDFQQGHLENLQIQTTGDGLLSLAPQALPGAWQAGPKLPKALSAHGMVVSGNRVFVLGGKSGTFGAYVSDVYAATLDPVTGAPGEWTLLPQSLPAARGLHGVAEYDGFIYVVGGDAPSENVDVRPEVYFTRVKADGTLEDWRTTTPLPPDPAAGLSGGKDLAGVVAYRGHLYVISGATQEVFAGTPAALSAPIKADGSLGEWRNSPMPTLAGRMGAPAVGAYGFLYSVGGERLDDLAQRVILPEVWRADVKPDGTVPDWLQLPVGLPSERAQNFNAGVSAGGRLFSLGGWAPSPVGTVRSATVFAGQLDPDGGVTAWEEATALPQALMRGAAAVVPPVGASAGTLIFSGGEDQAGNDTQDVYFAPLAAAPGGPQFAYQGSFEGPLIALQGQTVKQVTWVASGAGTVALRWRAADAQGIWTPWSDPATASPVVTTPPDGATAFQYLLALSGDGTATPAVDSVTVEMTPGSGGTEIPGDLDASGKTDVRDVLYGLRVIATIITLTPEQQARLVRVGDSMPRNAHDGRFDVRDVIRLLQFLANLDTTYPT